VRELTESHHDAGDIYNIRLQMNGQDLDHKHILYAVGLALPTIIEKFGIIEEYITHTKRADYPFRDLDVNVDTPRTGGIRVIIAARNLDNNTNYPIEFLTQDAQEKQAFRQLYKKDISDKGTFISRVANTVLNTLYLIPGAKNLATRIGLQRAAPAE
jgi:hypothetical protein